ncbi:MAG: hypothetical protein IPH45_20935 [Bacteroidales bacterium]|nr:hypothetical protein [Bacteroidales bacterium]
MGPYVQGSVPGTLPATSIEGFTGTWAPATISTATVGFATYVFTPDAGQCALPGSLTIEVTAIPCPAATTWTGFVDNDWFNAANWNPAVPCATTAVTVPQVLINLPNLWRPTDVASITIESGASFIGSEFLTVGNALVKQNFPVPGYHYISSPFRQLPSTRYSLEQNAVCAYRMMS